MEISKIIFTSVSSVVILFLLAKLIGRRQISQLSLFDYINGITIGSIGAEMATSLDNFQEALIAMLVYGGCSVLLSVGTSKSITIRRLVSGHPLILFENDILYEKNLSKGKLDIDEVLTQCRNSGYFALDQIHSIILESNGKLSILPKSEERPATPRDLNLKPAQDTLVANVVLDGNIMEKNLKFTGKNKVWLEKQLRANDVKDINEVFLATCDSNGKITVYKKTYEPMTRDIFT